MSVSTLHDPERRRYPRIRAKIPVELARCGVAAMRTSTDEISLCGCYIETMFTMDIGTKLGVVFSIGGERVCAAAVVATKYPQVGNGIDFIQMTAEDRLKLNSFISDSAAKG
jgi:hypothetical protein